MRRAARRAAAGRSRASTSYARARVARPAVTRSRAREHARSLSYLWLRGKCSACNAAIGVRYPVVEALTGLATAYCAWRFGFGFAAFGAMLFVWCMIALAFIDIDTQLLPDSITLPLVWAGLALQPARDVRRPRRPR